MDTFEETQHFRQPWIWLLMAVLVGVTVVPLGVAIWRQLALHHASGSQAASASLGTSITSVALMASIIWLLSASYLRVEVRDAALFVRFFPFIRSRLVPYSEIRVCASRTYRPIAEYGGWGVRFGRHGKAYNVSGNRGVQLELASGEKLLLGSQRAESLCAAIEAHRRG